MAYLIYISLSLFGLLSCLGIAASIQDQTVEVVVATTAFSAASVFLARAAWRRDPIALGKYVVGLLLAVVAVSSLAAFIDDEPLPARITLAVASVLSVAGIILVSALARRDEGSAPNPLAELVGQDAIFEEAGVHFAVCTGTEATFLQIYLQNCWDRPRKVELDLHDDSLGGREIQMAKRLCVDLPALAVGFLSVPVSVAVPGSHSLVLTLEVTGEGGSRRRRIRGRPASKRVDAKRFALHLLMGEITWGGGLRVELECREAHVSNEKPPPPTWTQLHLEDPIPSA